MEGARGAASHQPITNPATGRTTVYVEISTVGCIEGVATCQRLAPPCTRPGSVKSQGLLPVALGPPESLPALPLVISLRERDPQTEAHGELLLADRGLE